MSTIVMVLLISTVAGLVGIFVGAVVCASMCQRRSQPEHGLPRRNEMRRYMLMGLYCNAEDPRPFVHRPTGRGYTINVRKEELALVLWAMVATIAVAGLLLATAPKPV